MSRGHTQTAEHVAARIRSGQDHYAWLGDDVSVKGGRTRALRIFPVIPPCKSCGAARAERHHVDGDTSNNSPANVSPLCRRCHMMSDGRLAACSARMALFRPVGIAAAAAEKRARTACKRGHPLSGDNMYLNAGKRHCRACHKINRAAFNARRAS